MPREMTLLAPGLCGPAPLTLESRPKTPRHPTAAKWLSRVARRPAARDLYSELDRLFGPLADTGEPADLPIAALTLLCDSGERQPGYWLRADPVHIEAGHDRLIMAGSEVLRLDREEAAALCAELNEHMRADGLQLTAPVPTRWYCSWPEAPAVRFSPLPEVVDKDLYGHMPAGEEGRPWRRLLNQAQMVLHSSRINDERQSRGFKAINGLWFWGGGVLPPPRRAPYRAVWADDVLIRGLAMNAQISPLDLPDRADDWLSAAADGSHLAAITDVYDATPGEEDGTRAFAAYLDEQWLAPLFAALRNGELEKLILCPVDGYEYHVTRRGMRSWWRWW